MNGYLILVVGMQMGICHQAVNFHCNLFSDPISIQAIYIRHNKCARENHLMHGYQNRIKKKISNVFLGIFLSLIFNLHPLCPHQTRAGNQLHAGLVEFCKKCLR